MKKLLILISALIILSCTGNNESVERMLAGMTLEEKIGQMFVVRPEALDTGAVCYTLEQMRERRITSVSGPMRQKAQKYPMGGVILLDHNIKDKDQLKALTSEIHSLPGSPLIYIDEEGGRICRIASNPSFRLMKVPSMSELAASGRTAAAYEAGLYMGAYLDRYGIDVNLAPVADVNTNPLNEVIGDRAFSSDPRQAAPMVKSYLKGLQKTGIIGCLKHFPGHGDTQSDSNYGYAMSRKSWNEIQDCEMIPFRAGIKAGAKLILVAHISLPNILHSNIPASLSPEIIQEKLRGELGYRGVIMTDSMDMGAIVRQYPIQDAAIMAIKAGADIILNPSDYPRVFEAVLAAVRRGEISESRIDDSVRRILAMKAARQ